MGYTGAVLPEIMIMFLLNDGFSGRVNILSVGNTVTKHSGQHYYCLYR